MIPIPYRFIGAGLVILALIGAHLARVHHAFNEGHAAAVTEQLAAEALATSARLKENATIATQQDATNVAITKAKNVEIAPVRERIVTQRVYVGSAICGGPTSPPTPESAASSDGTNSPGRVVRPDLERDIRALKLAVEEDLATGRACQAFLVENKLVP